MAVHDWNQVAAGIFHDFHQAWIFAIKRMLNDGVLPDDHYALSEQITGGLGPDVLTLGMRGDSGDSWNGNGNPSYSPKETSSAGTSVATAPPQLRFAAESGDIVRKRNRIAIRHVSDDEVVAVIEIVSPGNKASRHALQNFVKKTVELLHAGVHFLAIDLFPPTSRDPQGIHGVIWEEFQDHDFALPEEQRLTQVAYSADSSIRAYIEPFAVSDRLTEMPLFLTPRHYVSVPLQESYDQAFQAVPRRWREQL